MSAIDTSLMRPAELVCPACGERVPNPFGLDVAALVVSCPAAVSR